MCRLNGAGCGRQGMKHDHGTAIEQRRVERAIGQDDSDRAPPAATHASGVARCVQRRVDTCGGATALDEQAQTLCRLGIDVRARV